MTLYPLQGGALTPSPNTPPSRRSVLTQTSPFVIIDIAKTEKPGGDSVKKYISVILSVAVVLAVFWALPVGARAAENSVTVEWKNKTSEAWERGFTVSIEACANVSGTFEEMGLRIWDRNKELIQTVSKTPEPASGESLYLCFDTAEEFFYLDDYYYTYQFYVIFNGTEYRSNTYGITTIHTHQGDEWIMETEPTCTSEGIQYYICIYCGLRISRGVPATGHSFSGECTDIEAAPTCTAPGTLTRSCTACDEKESREIPARGHDYHSGTCGVCGHKAPVTAQRLAGANRWETSRLVADDMKANLGVEKFGAVIIASGNDFADALAGSYLATVKKAPILLCWGKGGKYAYLDTDNIHYIKNNLAPGGTVYILGGVNAVPGHYESELKGYTVKRLGGENRFETNLRILEEAGVPRGSDVLVCTATNFADSLSASATGLPILLVHNESGKLLDCQKAYLAMLDCNYYIIGGTSAVSNNLGGQFFNYSKNVWRVSGANRFETSIKVARLFLDSSGEVVLAYAWNYPDGLCGGVLANSMNAPLILTMTDYESQAGQYTDQKWIDSGTVLGGTGLISDEAVRKIFSSECGNNRNRKSYGTGSCTKLCGTKQVVVLFLDDNGSSWDRESVAEKMETTINPGLDMLSASAAEWGIRLDFKTEYIYTDSAAGVNLKYNGMIEFGNNDTTDLLDAAAKSLGFGSSNSMDTSYRERFGAEEIIYLLMVNRDSRSYAVKDQSGYGGQYLERCVIFSNSSVHAIPHEILHIFGAEDLYRDGNKRVERAAMADELYYHDYMLDNFSNQKNVGAFTAYCIGWSHICPEVCSDPRWWS